ncbi:MAG: RNA 2',3'-cyclic phosphodiesterase [Verrucomicrobiae bacterium]|nr:RNA 2',3'-cyclic phosphodiesterase [Verrucomicrobiae bacterium]
MSPDRQPPKIRLFLALPIPDPVQARIERVQDELRPVLPPKAVRWTKREQFHLTLRFLGNVEAPRLPDLSHAVRDACSGVGPLPLRAERIGGFPSLRFPRVLWVWVHDDAEDLVRLQRNIEAAVGGFAEREETLPNPDSRFEPPNRSRRREDFPELQRCPPPHVGGYEHRARGEGKVFTGHVTIARLSGLRRAQAEILAKRAHEFVNRQFGEWTAGEVRLMRSELLQSGSVHTVLDRFALSG